MGTIIHTHTHMHTHHTHVHTNVTHLYILQALSLIKAYQATLSGLKPAHPLHHLQFTVKKPTLCELTYLAGCLSDPFDGNRKDAAALLLVFQWEPASVVSLVPPSTMTTTAITTTAATASSATEGDADAPALLCTGTRNAGSDDTVQDDQTVRATLEEIVALVGGADNERATYGVHLLVLWFENTICATTLSAMIPFHRQTMALTICTILLSELDAHITVAKASLVNAAQNTPIYSVLRALRQVLDVLGLSCLREVSKDRFLGAQWTAFVGKLLASL